MISISVNLAAFFSSVFAFGFTPRAFAKENMSARILAEYETAFNFDFQKTKIGGLSGLHCEGAKAWAVSDDRGQKGAPRFYEFEIKYQNSIFEVLPKAVHELHGTKENPLPRVLDLEAISRRADGDFVLSSEGDLNKVPRVPPSFLKVSEDGSLKQIYNLPDIFMPELTGKQKKGVQNNQAFEGMRWSEADQSFWALHESALFQDYNEVETIKGDKLHFVKLGMDSKSKANSQVSVDLKILEDRKYQLSPWTDTEEGKEIMRGVSEILEDGKESWWVLERGVRISLVGMKYSAALYHLDKDLKKTQIMDFKNPENFEGLCYGPMVDGKRTLLVVSDNNFSKREKTKWLLVQLP